MVLADGSGPRRVLVAGAGGFIGHNLVRTLKENGFWVRGVDIRRPVFEPTVADEFVVADLRELENCLAAVKGMQDVYQLAADMGGIGYITAFHAAPTRNNILINAHMLEASRRTKVDRYLYTSSACVYPSFLQRDESVTPLKESDAIPADPEKGYGWEKLFAEQLTTYYAEEYGLDVRIVRFHNIYGPFGAFEGGREKAPAAISRKVAEAVDGSSIDVWGDGQQTRSFCYIEDCVDGLIRLMGSGYQAPINLGTEELVTVDELVEAVCDVAGKTLTVEHDRSRPQGVRGRNSDNTLLQKVLRWQPSVSLRSGLEKTYPWIWTQLEALDRTQPPAPLFAHTPGALQGA